MIFVSNSLYVAWMQVVGCTSWCAAVLLILVKQFGAMSMDSTYDVLRHISWIVAFASHHLEPCFSVGYNNVHNLAKRGHEVFVHEHDTRNRLCSTDTTVVP